MATEVALLEEGARVTYATSHHENYLPKNILDRNADKPWMTDGFYPQSIVVTFPQAINVQSIDLKTYNVRELLVESSDTDHPPNFQPLTPEAILLQQTKGSAQTESLQHEPVRAQQLRFTIRSGYDIFCAVYRVIVMGGTGSSDKAMQGTNFSFDDAKPSFGGGTGAAPFQFGAAPGEGAQSAEGGGFQSTFRVPERNVRMSQPVQNDQEDEDDEDDSDQEGFLVENRAEDEEQYNLF